MNSPWTRISAVAALAFAAVSGQAAQPAQKVDINFDFRTPAGVHAPGRYTVAVREFGSGGRFIFLTNDASRRSVMFYTQAPLMKMHSEDPARVIFKCAASGCDLAEVWSDSNNGYTIRRNKQAPADSERSAVAVAVPLTVRAD